MYCQVIDVVPLALYIKTFSLKITKNSFVLCNLEASHKQTCS